MRKGEIPRQRHGREVEAKKVSGKTEVQGRARDNGKPPFDFKTKVRTNCGFCRTRNYTQVKARISYGQDLVCNLEGSCGNCGRRIVLKETIPT